MTETGREAESIKALRRSIELFREVGDALGGAKAMSTLGLALANLGRYDEAAAACREQITLCDSAGERNGKASALFNLSTILLHATRYRESIVASCDALAICQELNQAAAGVTALLENLGFACLKEERYRESIEWHEKVLEHLTKQDHSRRACARNYIGIALSVLGDGAAGAESFREAADEYTLARDYRNAGIAHQHAGKALLDAQRYEESIASNSRAADLLAAAGDGENEAQALIYLGLANSLLRRWEEGNKAYQRVYAQSKRRGDRSVAAMARALLGGNLVDSGDPEQALPFLRWALDEGLQIGDARVHGAAAHNLEVAQAKLARRKGHGGGAS